MVTVIAFASNTAKGHHLAGIWVQIFFVIFFASW